MRTINTERLHLRPLAEVDATQTYVDWLNDSEVNRYLETRHSVQTLDGCQAFIRQCNEEGSRLFGIFLNQDGRHIGNAKLGFLNPTYQRGQLSLFIGDKSCWGKGLSTEVVKALTRYGFERLGLQRIEAGCYADNLASLRVFIKAGYTVEGYLREHVLAAGQRTGCFWLGVLCHEYP